MRVIFLPSPPDHTTALVDPQEIGRPRDWSLVNEPWFARHHLQAWPRETLCVFSKFSPLSPLCARSEDPVEDSRP